MPIYKDRKVKTMLRSVLPSSGARNARIDKADAKRRARRNVNQALHDHNWTDDDDADLVMRIHDADRHQARDIRSVVRRRRDADKVNHFVRWAERLTTDIDKSKEKRERFISYIGGSGDLIREHAIGHFISDYQLTRDEVYKPWRTWYRGEPDARLQRDEFITLLHEAIDRYGLETLDHVISPYNERYERRVYPHRYERCKLNKHKCMAEHRKTTIMVTSITDAEGNRKWAWQWIDVTNVPRNRWDRMIPKGATWSVRESREVTHASEACKNKVALQRVEQVQRVVHYIFGKRKSVGFRTNYYERKKRRQLARAFWQFFKEEGLL